MITISSTLSSLSFYSYLDELRKLALNGKNLTPDTLQKMKDSPILLGMKSMTRRELERVVQHWNQIWRSSPPVLRVWEEGGQLRFIDTRPCACQGSWIAGELVTCSPKTGPAEM